MLEKESAEMFRQDIVPLEEALNMAHKAKKYAREQIIKGDSWLSSNDLSPELQAAVRQGMKDVRELERGKLAIPDLLEKKFGVIFFENAVETKSKYSLGNCSELAILALDYVVNYENSNINAAFISI